MGKVIISLFMVLSMLITPVAHAAGVDGDPCHEQSHIKKSDSKHAKAEHHCSCIGAFFKADIVAQAFVPVFSKAFMVITDETMTSVVVSPLPEPPSYV